MPELPEVETTRLGLLPHVLGKTVHNVVVRDRRLRWPVPAALARTLQGQHIEQISRRGKYLLWHCQTGFLLGHLGMSGSLRVLTQPTAPQKHDHLDIVFADDTTVRYTDPRRFGAWLWVRGATPSHALLDRLGPEPLSDAFDAVYLWSVARGRKTSIKEFIMNANIVVGVGNIYASEALFLARIHPTREAGRLSRQRLAALVAAIKETLARAIALGGSSLRDYVQASGEGGYFQLAANCYGRAGLPCPVCQQPIRSIRQGQRATYFCSRCQK